MTEASLSQAKPDVAAPRYQPLVIVAVAVAAGIGADRAWALPLAAWWTTAILAWGLWLVCWRRHWDRASGALLLASLAAWGGAWHHCHWSLFTENDLGFYTRADEQPICLEAVTLTGVRIQPAPPVNPMRLIPLGDRTSVEVAIVGVRNGDKWQPASGRARLLVNGRLQEVHAGDRLLVFAELAAQHPPLNPGEFDFAAYARADRRRALLRAQLPDCVTVVSSAGPISPRRWLEAARNAGNRLLNRYLDAGRAGLASALLIGTREEITAEETVSFMETGTIHILSISGTHVGILAALAFFAVRVVFMPRVLAAVVVAGLILFYTLLTGAEPPAVRALILVMVTCAAYALGRRPLGLNSLAAAALVVLAINPADLFRIGVQLSFLCVLGLIWFGPWQPSSEPQGALEKLIAASRPWPVRAVLFVARWFWRMTVLGAMIWLLTLPLVMARFHLLSISALLLNTLLWVPTTVILWSGLGVLVFGGLVPWAAAPLGWCCDKTLGLLQLGVETAKGIPGSYFWVPGPADWWLAGFYGGLALLAAFPRMRPPRRWCVALAAGWVAVGFAPALNRSLSSARLECTFLAVDHGCATVLRLPSGKTVLYDAGKFSSPETGAQLIAGGLWSMGLRHLDAVILSHPDADHYNALPGLLERFSVGVVYVSPMMFEQKNQGLAVLREDIDRAGVPVREILAGDQLSGGDGCRITVLHPTRRGVLRNDNANSIVLAVEYQGRRILLPGDLEPPGLKDLLAEEPQSCDVLLAPHHGSRGSDPPGLAQWCHPRWVVISGGRRYDLRQTLAAYREVGSQIVHTGELGAITAIVEQSEIRLENWLPLPKSLREQAPPAAGEQNGE